jgi:cytochrome-b5 reductase
MTWMFKMDLINIAGASVVSVVVAYVAYRMIRGNGHPRALVPGEKKMYVLVDKKVILHDTRRFRFALPSAQHVLGLPVGKYITVSAKIGGQPVVRSYTPPSSDDDVGYFDLVVKIYFRNVSPKFPDGGKMSQYLESLAIGDSLAVAGPVGYITYLGNGKLQVENRLKRQDPPTFRTAKNIGMMAGGTGITPMLQIIRHILKHSDDRTHLSMIFANQTEDDILVREELEECAKDPRFDLWFTLDRPPANWKYSTGFITTDMISKHLPPVGPDTQILMCGPPPMIKFACIENLKKVGFTSDNWLEF